MQQFTIPDFYQSRLVVIGDLMVDHYLSGTSSRISPEAPVPILLVNHEWHLPGGAANVAANLAKLGCHITLLGVYADDAAGNQLVEQLQEMRVQLASPPLEGAKTIVKQRILANKHQMLRIDHEQSFPDCTKQLAEVFEKIADKTDLLILSDYGKGTLTNPQVFIEIAKRYNMQILVDPKGTDFSHYKGASIITPNQHEFVKVVGICSDEEDAQQKAQELISKLELEALLVTKSEAGMSLYRANSPSVHIAAQAREVFDVTGAGDTVIATLGASLGCFVSLVDAVTLANHAAGIAVSKIGVASISTQELRDQIALVNHSEFRDQIAPVNHSELRIVNQSQLDKLVAQSREHSESIVLTNGCFDLLHSGHITYLEEAKALGDRLIVLVNSDDSVKKLKGNGRPIVPLEQRMQLIAALSSVDLVCAFEQETPAELITRILPDVLVKGGDYNKDDYIAGAKEVLANGGKVEVLSLVDDMSTSNLIAKVISTNKDDKHGN